MTKGNINVSMRDGLFYIPYNYIHVYRLKTDKSKYLLERDITPDEADQYVFDKKRSQSRYDLWINSIVYQLTKRFKTYSRVDKYPAPNKRILLENSMFQIVIEDNKWSFAVELINRPGYKYPALQTKLFKNFFKGLREILLNNTDVIYTRNGTYSAQAFTQNDETAMNEQLSHWNVKYDPNAKVTIGYNPPPKPEKKPKEKTKKKSDKSKKDKKGKKKG